MAVSTRRSSSGSASGGGSGRCSGRRGLTRRTSSTRSEGGLSAATDIGPPGAPTTATRCRAAVNSARVPVGDHSPNSATARARAGSRPRSARGRVTAEALPGLAMDRSTVAAVSASVPSAR